MQNYSTTTQENDYTFSDLIDITEFEELLESFYKATGIPNGIISNEGEIISQKGWVSACSLFHRINPESNLCCVESNLKLMENLYDGKVNHSLCKNGLFDYATPLVIEGKVLATIFLGQVLEKKPNTSFFVEQAKKYKYNEKQYLKAINEVPIVSREEMVSLMDCIVKMAKMLAQSSLSKYRQNKLEDTLEKTTEQQIQLKDILDFSPVGVGWTNSSGQIEYLNHQFTKLFGYTIDELPDIDTWAKKVYPDTIYRETVIIPWLNGFTDIVQKSIPIPEIEVTAKCKDGFEKRILIKVSWIGDKLLANFTDITEHWKSELRNRAHDKMLEMVAKGASLSSILYNIVETIEAEDSTSLCSVLLMDEERKHLLIGASTKLPEFYNEAINGIEIGDGVGSCGTAAYLKKRIIVEDINTHKYWQPYLELAKKANLGACWSEPILSFSGDILGTFAIYHKKPTTPSSVDIERISFAANLASIAIENRNAHLELEHRAYFDYLTNLANRRYFIEHAELELSRFNRYGGKLSLIMFDIDHFKKFNDTYGHKIGDLVLQKIADISRTVLRDIDIIGRIGGEEFAILLPQTNIKEASKVAERLRVEISKGEISFDDKLLSNFTASFGVVEALKGVDIDELLVQSDLALYDAKNSGRNRVCTYKRK